ncbi:MAG: trigger factor [Alphaproteobacteria bacterium]
MTIEKIASQDSKQLEFKITTSAADFVAHWEAMVKKISQEATLEGYEKGMIPPSVIEEKFKDRLLNIVVQDLIVLKTKEVLTQENITDIFPPKAKVLQAEKGKDCIFQIQLEKKEVLPQINFSEINLQGYKVLITDVDLDEGLQKIAKAQNIDLEKDPKALIEALGGKEKNMQEVRQKLKEDLKWKIGDLCRKRLKTDLIKNLITKYDFSIPASIIEQEYSIIARQNLPKDYNPKEMPAPEMMIQGEKKEQLQKMAKDRAYLGIILADIAEKESIRVEKDEVHQTLHKEASRFKGEEQKYLDFYKNNPVAFRQFQIPILQNKVLDFILLKAQITTQEITLAEFRAL